MIGAVLLQPGKTDAGALFTSNVSSSAFSPRGTATVLSKVTIVAATTFMLSALMLAMPALNGNVSVLSSNPDAPADSSITSNSNSSASDANANKATPANANAAVPAETNTAPATTAPEVVAPAANAAAKPAPAKSEPVKAPAKAPANK